MKNKDLLELLKTEIKPAVGCTEPVAVAYASALAKKVLDEEVEALEIRVDPNIYKNGMGVFVPGTQEKGLAFAAALGGVGGDPQLELEVLKNCSPQAVEKADILIAANKIKIAYIPNHCGVYIDVYAKSLNNTAQVIIEDAHTNVVLQKLNGQVLIDKRNNSSISNGSRFLDLRNMSIQGIINEVLEMNNGELKFLDKVIETNTAIAQLGLTTPMGMGVGYKWHELIEQGLVSNDIINLAKSFTAAATDARMSGQSLAVMSCAGSGNQGLMASLPLITAANSLRVSRETLYKALAISFLITIYVKSHIGRLSAICGCAVAASPGAGAGIGYLLGLNSVGIKGVINNIIGDIAGMICDGAKPGCSLKMFTAVDIAIQMAFLAKNNVIIEAGSGIVADSPEETIRNIGFLSNPGMLETDKTILKIMIEGSRDMGSIVG